MRWVLLVGSGLLVLLAFFDQIISIWGNAEFVLDKLRQTGPTGEKVAAAITSPGGRLVLL
jgi:hypothetical protein